MQCESGYTTGVPRGLPADLFPTDSPLAPADMIGRADDVERLAVELRHGVNCIIAEPRRTGKTTVCDAALARLDRGRFYVVALDLRRIDDIEALADALIERTMENRPAVRRALRRVRRLGRTLYDRLGGDELVRLSAHGALEGVEMSFLLPGARGGDPVAKLDHALGVMQRVAAQDNKRLVLYLDEFQEVETIGESYAKGWGMTLKRKMRAEFQRDPDVSFLFSGSYEHMMARIFGHRDEPFFQFGSFRRLSEITPGEWADGLAARFDADGTQITPQALGRIVELGRGHPRATMLVAQQAYLASVLAETRTVSADLVAVAYRETMRSELLNHEAIVELIRHLSSPAVNRLALKVITAIAAGQRPYHGHKSTPPVARAIRALVDAGLIERAGSQRWRVVDPLLGDYLRTRTDLG